MAVVYLPTQAELNGEESYIQFWDSPADHLRIPKEDKQAIFREMADHFTQAALTIDEKSQEVTEKPFGDLPAFYNPRTFPLETGYLASYYATKDPAYAGLIKRIVRVKINNRWQVGWSMIPYGLISGDIAYYDRPENYVIVLCKPYIKGIAPMDAGGDLAEHLAANSIRGNEVVAVDDVNGLPLL